MGSLFNLEKQMEAYAPYHMNKINQWIHIVCVPIILWTALVWVASAVGPLVPGLDLGFGLLPYGPFVVNGAFVVITVYALFYLLLDPVAGTLYLPVLYGLAYTATHFAQTAANPNTTALVIHVVCWILQFLGHGLAEKRAPALVDSFVQSLLLAPIFVWLEVLFMLGYNPQLHKRIVNSASRNIVAFRKAQQAKKAGAAGAKAK